MHHLYQVTFTDHSLRPIGAADDRFIQLDGYPLRRERKCFEKMNEIDVDGDFARLAVEIYRNHS